MKKKLLIMLLSVTATAMTFAQQSGENSPLTPVEPITFPNNDIIEYIPFCTDKYFVVQDINDARHVYDSTFKEIYTIQSELIDNVFYNVPCSHDIVDLNTLQQQFDISEGTFTQNFSTATVNLNILQPTVK